MVLGFLLLSECNQEIGSVVSALAIKVVTPHEPC